jgi:Sec-independent protein translocase protein TatA
MLNLDPAKLLIIAVVVIILLGPDKLPQVARQVGGVWRSFNEFRHRMEADVRSSIPDLPSSTEIARLARSPSALLNHLSNMSPNGTVTGEGIDDGQGGAIADGASGSDANSVSGASSVAYDAEANGADSSASPGPPESERPSQVFVPGDPNLN